MTDGNTSPPINWLVTPKRHAVPSQQYGACIHWESYHTNTFYTIASRPPHTRITLLFHSRSQFTNNFLSVTWEHLRFDILDN
jgi:hypothetical protein